MEKKMVEMKSQNKMIFGVLALLLAFLFFFVIDRFAIYLTDIFLKGSFGYTWLSVHHVIQILLTVTIMSLPWWRKPLSEWGLNLKNHKKTFNIILKFTIGWIFFSTIFIVISQWIAGWPKLLGFYLSTENILIYLFFESIIVGISEEIVFRGLVHGTLSPYFKKRIKLGFTISYAGLISALFFAIAHIGFQFFHLASHRLHLCKYSLRLVWDYSMPSFVKKRAVYWGQSWRIISPTVGFPSCILSSS